MRNFKGTISIWIQTYREIFKSTLKYFNSPINIAWWKIPSNNVIVPEMFSRNFRETAEHFKIFRNNMEGTPAYWKEFLHDVLA